MSMAQPFLRQKLRRRSKAEPLYGQFIEERFGQYTHAAHEEWIWIHAVSLGETRTLRFENSDETFTYDLEPGSIFIMRGESQNKF